SLRFSHQKGHQHAEQRGLLHDKANAPDQALRLRLKDETSVILSDLYLQILQYIEMHKTTLTDIIINDRESVLS
ncbi:TPA: hypothetical protein ACGS02_004413, partial [Shigella sonnei]